MVTIPGPLLDGRPDQQELVLIDVVEVPLKYAHDVGSEGTRTLTEQQLRKVIQRKLVAYKRQDQAKGLRFSLKVDHILALKEAQNNHCTACNIELLWASAEGHPAVQC